jgi:parvulin-like peptidyl-prolyl isomerase
MWRRQAIREMLIQREVHSKLYWEPTAKDVKDYFEKNRAKFTKPETVTLSEIFLAFAGRDEAAVREKAKQLVTQLRGGADFQKLAVENSDKPEAATTKGKVDTFEVKQLDTKFADAIKGLNKGGITEPIPIEDIGLTILRVDERTAASPESHFDERNVRMAMMSEKAPARVKEFMSKLREGSYIKINDTYRPLVAPILFEEERKEKTATKSN